MALAGAYGRRLIPNIIDERARTNPDRPVFSIPVVSGSTPLDLKDISSRGNVHSVPVSSNHTIQGFRDISARTFANAVDRVAWWLEANLGRGSNFPSIGYIGPHDIRYALFVLGCVKAGYQAVILSPRNSIEADIAVLEATACDIWVLPNQHPKFLSQLLIQRPMKVLTIAEVEDLLQEDPVPEYTYNKTFEDASEEPFCVMHTSGSTGHPKPIFWKHSMLATLDATRLLPVHHGRPPWVVVFEEGDRFYSSFPFYHSAAMTMNVLINAFYGTCNVLGPANISPSLTLIDTLLDKGRIKVWSIIPSIVDDIGETPAVHEKFKDAKIIIASGGPVGYESANKATKSVRIMNLTGTTEGIFMGSLLVEPEDWIYFCFHPYANFDFREIEPGVFEQCIVRDESKVGFFQGIFHTFPDIQEMSLKDLYTQHPTKPGLWLYKGRTDDVVVLSNGNKIHPKDVEAVIGSHPAISACLIVGTGHFQASLLIELVNPLPESSEDQLQLLDDIYETVKRANASKPPYAAITKEYIMFAKPDMPFARTDKNTVKRRMTVVQYEKEIEQFYKKIENGDAASFETSIDANSPETTAQDIRKVIVSSLPSNDQIDFEDDLFAAGLDSVLSIRVIRCLSSAAEKYVDNEVVKSTFKPQFLYSNPTINQLSAAFYDTVHRISENPMSLVEKQTQKIKEFRTKYTADLPESSKPPSRLLNKDANTVILTGSTGSLGSYILESLLRQPNVKTIYCLNRAEDGKERQSQVNKPRGLTAEFPDDRVHFLRVDLSKPNFALEEEQYTTLLQETTHIIHCQWPVNFNLNITSFEPHIKGVRHLIDFCLSSKLAPSLFFLSSVATVSHLKDLSEVPEVPFNVMTTTNGGYGASKQVCELILQDAYERSGVNATVCRVGQVAGPVLKQEGMWSKQEWVPTIIASSKYLSLLPSTLGSMDLIDWIPVDLLGDIIVELSSAAELPHAPKNGFRAIECESSTTIPVYHAVNPEFAVWADLLPLVREALSGSNVSGKAEITVVSWNEWVDALAQSQSGAAEDVMQNPGLKLLDFFSGLKVEKNDDADLVPRLDTEHSEMKSGTLAGLRPVGKEWMEIWLQQWMF